MNHKKFTKYPNSPLEKGHKRGQPNINPPARLLFLGTFFLKSATGPRYRIITPSRVPASQASAMLTVGGARIKLRRRADGTALPLATN